MPNVLVLSFEGFSFSSRQLFEHLLPKLLSRAVVHESLTIQDALHYISSGWPNILLVTDPIITEESDESKRLLAEVVNFTREGCTTILMGFFAAAVNYDRLDEILKDDFGLRWRVSEYTKHDTRLHSLDENLIRASSLVPTFCAKALYLGHVPTAQTIYGGRSGANPNAYAAFARVGLGKLGYIGDVNFTEEPERLILAMCHLDRPEDSGQSMETGAS
ncbi:hypothetical protein K458DRAFT_298936 [Lentithecium fluviatile CBS 122367]|uniref:Uncharacterized protein n=1 Tax=Lentithecium fluviatile CBS 122367 TaxID=1168545 RepID=A0A6G1J7Q0_9PLEO|nr:hypothetical protein K458DRAFT_298936 [Lentithecium fluviatile CBS 122367]